MSGLVVADLSLRFGGLVALDGVTFTVTPRQIMGLIGPNGAGKTTVFNCISRLYTPDRGSITFDGHDLLRVSVHHVVRLGIARTFQQLELFPTMPVGDVLLVGEHSRSRADVVSTALRLPWVQREERDLRRDTGEILDLLDLTPYRRAVVGGLPFGIQKRVDIARALSARPRLLLLDEPAGGLNHEELDDLARLILRIRDERNLAILLVEHHMSLVMSISDRVTVLDFGRKIAEGTPDEVRANPAVIEAYLGEEVADASAV